MIPKTYLLPYLVFLELNVFGNIQLNKMTQLSKTETELKKLEIRVGEDVIKIESMIAFNQCIYITQFYKLKSFLY